MVAYNHILPQWLIDFAPHGIINVHPSLLPKLRGASPIRSALLHNTPEYVGASIMLLDAEMDSGPILAQQPLVIAPDQWPIPGPALDEALGRLGGALLADTLVEHHANTTTPVPQQHAAATYCGRLQKGDSELTLDPHDLPTGIEAKRMMAHIAAFMGIGESFFLYKNNRIKITAAHLEGERLVIDTVVPAGKGPQSFTVWLKNQA